jgi:ketosteroid isomerase-like protein
VKTDAAIETELIEVLESFCSALEDRDVEAVIHLLAPDPDVVVVTSEESLLRGPIELRRFLDGYANGPTTYSWKWDRHDVSGAGSVAWLLAEGTETAVSPDRRERHRYRMTMVLERRGDRWLLMQVHGSSPH